MRKLIVSLLLISAFVPSINATEISEQKQEKVEVNMIYAIHNNAYLLAAIPRVFLFLRGFSNDIQYRVFQYDNDQSRMISLAFRGKDFTFRQKVNFFVPILIAACCVRLAIASFWIFLGGKFLKYITKECMVDQRTSTYKSEIVSDNFTIVQEC